MSVIFWAGVPSYSCNVVVERFPNQPGPSRRYETIQVAGRNGDLLIDTGAYDNYTQPMKCISTPIKTKLQRAQGLSAPGFNLLSAISASKIAMILSFTVWPIMPGLPRLKMR